jgi:pimeloyl-ACP methyl ester carboxylesterase
MSSYAISVTEEKINSLRVKLEQATFPDELDNAGWDYGSPLADIKRLTNQWKSFDWRKQEAKLNELPNFRQNVHVRGFGGLDIHYLHQPSSAVDAIPLLFVHGWPGSYLEVTKMLPSLSQSNNGVSFHVVAPSLPNFGWSQGVKAKGFGLAQYAEVCDQLMRSLGYKRYATQGGDWGFYITRAIGLLYPKHVLGSHINMIRASKPTFRKHPLLAIQHALKPYNDRENNGFARTEWFITEGSGYKSEQSTKPQTLGYGLHDSPVALLAWIYEKLHDWTDAYPWTDEEILTWASIYYYSTAGPAASLRIYYEVSHSPSQGVTRDRMQEWIDTVPLGLAHSPRELSVVPSTWARTLGPVVFESFKSRGGHFAAWENPEEIAGDLFQMFGKGSPCYGHARTGSKL